MKKLIIAAIAATMASVPMADISIKGDAFFAFAGLGTQDGGNSNKDAQRVRLHVTGKKGDTKVHATFRNDGDTRVDRSSAPDNAVTSSSSQSGDTITSKTDAALRTKSNAYVDTLYMTTKIGAVNVKTGDFYGTVGLGAWSFTREKENALLLTTKAGNINLGMFTHKGSEAGGADSTNVSAATKIGAAKVKVVHNPNSDWTNVSATGSFGGVSVAVEQHDGDASDTSLLQLSGKAGNVKWAIAQLKNDVAYDGNRNHRLAPLGSTLIGKGARGGTPTAVANANNFTKITGVSASTKMAGNTVKGIYTKSTLGEDDKVTGTELIVTRPVAGAKLTMILAKLSDYDGTGIKDGTNKAIRFDVKF